MTARKRKAAAILILLDVVEDEDDLGHYSKRGKTRGWMRKRREKGYFNNIFAERIPTASKKLFVCPKKNTILF